MSVGRKSNAFGRAFPESLPSSGHTSVKIHLGTALLAGSLSLGQE